LLNKVVSLKNLPALLIILLVVHGSIYAGMYPLWEGWDESSHFAYIQYTAENISIPNLSNYVSDEIMFTLDKLPMRNWWETYNIPEELIKNQPFSTYWGDFDLQAIKNSRSLISSQPLESRVASQSLIPIYESQHPPVGYLIQVPIYTMFYDQDVITRAYALRIFSVLVAAVAAIFAYKTISLIFQDKFMRIGSLMFIVFNPMFMTNIGRVNNETITFLYFFVLDGSVSKGQNQHKACYFNWSRTGIRATNKTDIYARCPFSSNLHFLKIYSK